MGGGEKRNEEVWYVGGQKKKWGERGEEYTTGSEEDGWEKWERNVFWELWKK